MQILPVLLLVVGGLCAFSLCGGFYLFKKSFERKPDSSESFETDLPDVNSEIASHTKDPLVMKPLQGAKKAWLSEEFETSTIQSFDGIPLVGYFKQAADKNTVAILIHGYADSGAGSAYLAAEYNKRGVCTLSLDNRAHGKSGGTYTSLGYKEGRDISLWVDYLKIKVGEDCKIILHGTSMGASSIYSYMGKKIAQSQSKNILCAVCDCGFFSLKKQLLWQLSFFLKGRSQAPARHFLLFGGSLFCALLNGFFFFQHAPYKVLKKRKETSFRDTPLLIFHGKNDCLILPKMAEDLYNNDTGKKKLVLIEKAPHIGSYFYDPTNYFNEIWEVCGLKK